MSAPLDAAMHPSARRTLGVLPMKPTRLLSCALAATLAFGASALATGAVGPVSPFGVASAANAIVGTPPAPANFTRTATYPVFQNVPAGVDPAAETVAEISAVSADGRTLIYTDALGKRIGFLDITDPAQPVGLGSVSLADLGHADDQPTSVAVYGDYVLVVIDETGGNFTAPKGRLDVLRLSDRSVVASIDLAGQPDSIAISGDGAYAAIAIENQRDEEFTPAGGEEGDLPQLPAGFVQVIELDATPADWAATPIPLVNPDGSALASFTAAGIDSATDPEPEYVTINGDNKLAVTLQENNGIVVIDLATRAIDTVFSAGSVAVTGIDVKKDKVIDLTGSIAATPREPDSIAWVDATHVATANEGDWKGGTRGWTIFDTTTGTVAWDAGNTFEHLAVKHGLYNDDRAAKKGSEPEGLAIGEIDGVTHAFVASERSNFVAVYDLSNPVGPVFVQLLFATNGPEGILPIPSRGLLAVSSETDDAAAGVRASVSLYTLGAATGASTRAASQPSIVSAPAKSGNGPIGWAALGALSAAPGQPGTLYTASDSALKPSTIFTVDVASEPAVITDALTVTNAGAPAEFDIEGLFARPQGGFWLASEGATGAENKLYLTDAAGAVEETVELPADVTAHINKWGLEGVTATTDDAGAELVYVALQRPLWTDPAITDPAIADATVDGANVTRIGRYDVAAQSWSWFGYELEAPAAGGTDWVGLSEIVAVDANTLAVIERDKLNGPAAANKRIYTVEVPDAAAIAAGPGLVVAKKTLALDVLPALRETAGWTQEKLEGLTIGADGNVYAVTDNDGLKDATGETVFLRLGAASTVFGAGTTDPEPTEPKPTDPKPTDPKPTDPKPTDPAQPALSLGAATVTAGGTIDLSGSGFAPGSTVTVELHSTPVVLGAATADASGAITLRAVIPAATPAGTHSVVVLQGATELARIAVTVTAANAGPGTGSGTTTSTGTSLASTGIDPLWPATAALALLAVGAGALVFRRRSTRASRATAN